jgi:endonuclease YncB( thermonuclease family)
MRLWFAAAAVIQFVLAAPSHAQTLAGQASVVDGDTIEIHRQRIRLSGIDAPESDQICRGDDSLPYRCGAKAANELDRFIAGRPVSCEQVDVDRYKRVVAFCSVDHADLGEWLVRQGLAVDWPRYSRGKYAAAQGAAKQADRGVWSGSFVRPWDYRACRHEGGRPSDCSD